jgi:hypothetical protein
MPASFVLASLRVSTYRSVRLASSLAAAALDGHFEHPAATTAQLPSTQALNSDHNDFHYTFVQALIGMLGRRLLRSEWSRQHSRCLLCRSL